jgi:diaminopimelate decarboxylase
MPPDASDARLRLSDELVRQLVAEYGTPLYVLDEAHLRARISAYREAFLAAYPSTELVYAAKANSALAVLRIAHQAGCMIDVASEGELRAALAAGVPAQRCLLHGNAKSVDELSFAMQAGVGFVVVDSFPEIDRIFELTQGRPGGERLRCPDLLLRLAPGVDPVTHAKIATGQADTKFGFNIANGAAHRAVCILQGLGLPLVGFHCHVGSQLLDPEAQRVGGELIARFAVEMLYRRKLVTRVLNLGGGLGVRYLDGQRPTPVDEYCRLVVDSVRPVLDEVGLTPKLMQEPGRSIVAESGVTLYTIQVVKTVPSPTKGLRSYVSVDGGLADNPRPALYQARYTVLHTAAAGAGTDDTHREDWTSALGIEGAEGDAATEHAFDTGPGNLARRLGMPTGLFTVAGRHCETDMLFEDVELPSGTKEGDHLQALCTGAYNASMASNYNRYPRPAMVLLRDDGTRALIQSRETWDQVLARELLPEGL